MTAHSPFAITPNDRADEYGAQTGQPLEPQSLRATATSEPTTSMLALTPLETASSW